MKKLLMFSILSLLTTGVVFAADRNALPDPTPVVSGSTENPLLGGDSQVTPAATCFEVWECRRCGSGRNQNILVQECDDGTTTIISAGACGVACF